MPRLDVLVGRYPVAALLLLAVPLGWWPWLLFGEGSFGPGVSLAAVIVVALTEGKRGGGALLGQLKRWRVGGRWNAVAVGLPVAATLLAVALNVRLGVPPPTAAQLAGWPSAVLLLPVYFLLFGAAEELGRRGYAQDRLQQPLGALSASLVVGVAWALWHLPQWWIPETGQAAKWPFAVFAAGTVAQSVGLAWLYHGARASILLVALAHAALNLAPEPWAAAWRLLPEGERGSYRSVLIAAVWVLAAALLIALAEPRSLSRWRCRPPRRRRPGPRNPEEPRAQCLT